MNVCEYTLPGMFIKEHRVKVPLDWSQLRDGRTLDLFVREVVWTRASAINRYPNSHFFREAPAAKGRVPRAAGRYGLPRR